MTQRHTHPDCPHCGRPLHSERSIDDVLLTLAGVVALTVIVVLALVGVFLATVHAGNDIDGSGSDIIVMPQPF
jgi:hypothetical protein